MAEPNFDKGRVKERWREYKSVHERTLPTGDNEDERLVECD